MGNPNLEREAGSKDARRQGKERDTGDGGETGDEFALPTILLEQGK